MPESLLQLDTYALGIREQKLSTRMIGTIQYATSGPSALHEASEAEDILYSNLFWLIQNST